MMSRQTPTAYVYRCDHKQRSKDSTYGSCRNILIVYLYAQHIDVLLLAHRWVPGYQRHSILSNKLSSRTVLAELTELAEGAEPSAEVVRGCEEFLCTQLCPGWLYNTHGENVWWFFSNYWPMNNDYTKANVFITGLSLFYPIIHESIGVWTAPARWPTVVSAVRGNTRSRIQSISPGPAL